jgi:hypothetical protein
MPPALSALLGLTLVIAKALSTTGLKSTPRLRPLKAKAIKIELSVTTLAPIWASKVPSRREPTYRPDPEAIADFVAAVPARYATRIAS